MQEQPHFQALLSHLQDLHLWEAWAFVRGNSHEKLHSMSFLSPQRFCTSSLLWRRVIQLNCSLKSYLLLLSLKLSLLILFDVILEDSEQLHLSSHLRLFRLLLCPPPWFSVLTDKGSIPSKQFQTLEHLCFHPTPPPPPPHFFEMGGWGQDGTHYSSAVTLWICTVTSTYFLVWSSFIS